MEKDCVQAIFFSEFHHTAGPVVSYQAPEEFPIRDQFDVISVYVIPKPTLYDKIVTVNALGHKIVGCPHSIENKKYERNAFIFNCVFVFSNKTDTKPFEGVVKKLCKYLTAAELESEFLSSESTRPRLPEILSGVRDSMNQTGHCLIPLDTSTDIHLTTIRQLCEPPVVADHHVPLFCCEKPLLRDAQFDLTVQQILPYIDGFSHVQSIAAKADVQDSLVRVCIQHLVYFGLVTLVPIFQYSNVYIPTGKLEMLFTDKALQLKCLDFISQAGLGTPHIADILKLFSGLGPGVTVRDLCLRFSPSQLMVDERLLIQFGVKEGLLRRLHKYPILLSDSDNVDVLQISHLLTGCYSDDEICCNTGLSSQQLDALIEGDHHIVVCWK